MHHFISFSTVSFATISSSFATISFATLTLAATLLSGCPETTRCHEGQVYSRGAGCGPSDGGGDAESLDGSRDAEQDAGPCGGACEPDFCDVERNACLDCRVSMGNVDCDLPATPVCDEGDCVTCATDADCERFDVVAPECGPAGCVACTVANEAEVCAGFTCNPISGRCSDVVPQTVGACELCVSDSQCIEDYACVPMFFEEVPRGGRCLKDAARGGCEPPLATPITGRVSLSNVSGLTYCGVNEELTTCEAVIAVQTRCRAALAETCPMPGSVCRTINLVPEVCSYPCDGGLQCGDGLTCPAAGDRFCQ